MQRKYYGRAHKILRDARQLLEKGEWDKAIELWKNNVNSEHQVLAKHCSYNLVLSEEINNNLEEALKNALRYKKKYQDRQINPYIETLQIRLDDKEKLDKQLGIVEK